MTHPLRRLAQEIMDDMYPEGTRLRKGMVTKHPDGRTVKIVGGSFWGKYGLSNHFDWREVMPDESLSDTLEWGYGWDTTEEGRKEWLDWEGRYVGQRHDPVKEQPIEWYKRKLAQMDAKERVT